MTSGHDWVSHARGLIGSTQARDSGQASQIELRQAISAAYYGLFHTLTVAGTRAFAAGGARLRLQATRAFNHTTMGNVCSAYGAKPGAPFGSALAQLNRRTPSPELVLVARAFKQLQEARYIADYDLGALIEYEIAAALVANAEEALAAFDRIASAPDTEVFLAALLLHDRWTRRG